MSEIVHLKGKLKLLKKCDSPYLETNLKQLFKDYNIEFDDDEYDSYEEQFHDKFYRTHFIINNKIYEISDEEDCYDKEIAVAKIIDNNTYEFEVRFYNGGASLSEVIEEAINKIKDEPPTITLGYHDSINFKFDKVLKDSRDTFKANHGDYIIEIERENARSLVFKIDVKNKKDDMDNYRCYYDSLTGDIKEAINSALYDAGIL